MALNNVLRAERVVTLRAIASAKATATARPKPFPFNFLSCSSPNPSADRRKKKGKEMVLSVGFATEISKQLTKTSFIAYAIPLVVSLFLCELWRYACGKSSIRSLTRNTCALTTHFVRKPLRYSRGSLGFD